MSEKILFVDDDPKILNAFRRGLRKEFDFHIAEGAEKALSILDTKGPFAVVISDQQMPGMKGTDFLKEVMTRDPMAIRIMLTGNADRETAIASVNDSGVFKYLNKPCPLSAIAESVREAIAEYHRAIAEKELLQGTLAGSLKMLREILAINDPESCQTTSSLRNAGNLFAKHTNMQKPWMLDMAITLATIGDVMLPPHLRAKIIDNEELDEIEKELVRSTPEVAHKLLMNIPRLSEVAEGIYYKNKYFNGTGFPDDDKAGGQIPLIARILHLLEYLVANSESGSPDEISFEKIGSFKGRFDPKLIDHARACFIDNSDVENKTVRRLTIKLDALLPGDKITDAIKTESGEVALAAGSEMTEALIQRMHQFNKLRPLVQPIRVNRYVLIPDPKSKDAA